MDFESVPIIRLEIERLKHTVMSSLGTQHSDLGLAINSAIDKALQSYDFDREVSRIVHQELTKQITNYFSHEEGYRAISQSIHEMFEKLDE